MHDRFNPDWDGEPNIWNNVDLIINRDAQGLMVSFEKTVNVPGIGPRTYTKTITRDPASCVITEISKWEYVC